MKNLACGGHWILPVVAWSVLRRVENEEISYWQMVSCVSWPCFQERSGGDYGVLESLTHSYRTWTHNRLIRKQTPNQFGPPACWLNDWVFVCELCGCGFEPRYYRLNFRYRTCFEQGVPWHSGNYRVWIHSETCTWHDKNIQLRKPFQKTPG